MKAVRLPCVICDAEYGLEQVGTQLFISTGVCRRCYRAGQSLPSHVWCFGATDVYDEDNEPCSKTCPDRKICRKVVQGQLTLLNPDSGV